MNSSGVPRSAKLALAGIFERLSAEVRNLESEVGPERAWTLIEAHDNLVDLTSDDKTAQVEAAKRLAHTMISPKLGPLARRRMKQEAAGARMGVGDYLEKGLFPDGIIVAVGEMASSKKVRLGRKWVLDKDGKASERRPIYDLSVGDFVHWLYQEASKACDAILMEKTYPKDALNLLEDGHQIDTAAIKRSRLGLIADLFTVELDPLGDRIIAVESAQEAKKELFTLMKKVSSKEQALLKKALDRDGELVELLHTQGQSLDSIRQTRKRLRNKLR